MARILKSIRIGLGLLAGLAIAAATAIYFVDLNEYRGVLAARLGEALGRPLQIDGDVKLRLGLHTGFSASGVSLANSADDKPGSMARIGRISFGLALWPLLQRNIQIDRLQIEDGEVVIERQPDGRFNWDLGQGDGESQWSPPRIKTLRLLRTKVIYRDGGTDIVMTVRELTVHVPSASAPAEIALVARLQDNPVRFTGRLDSLDGLLNGREIRLEGAFEAAGTKADIKGRLFRPLAGRGVDIHVAARTDRLQSLLLAVGAKTALPGRADLAFDLSDRDGPLALLNLKANLLPAPGVQIVVSGQVGDVLALAGLDLDLELRAVDSARLSPLLGIELPSLPSVLARAHLAGSVARPTVSDLDLRAGAGERLLLQATGAIAEPLSLRGLDLAVRLQGPDSAVLSSYAGVAVPALGRFDLAARLTGDGKAPSLSQIVGQFRHSDGTDIEIRGALQDPVAGVGLALQIKAAGPSLAALAALAGLDMRDPGAFKLSAALSGDLAVPAIVDLRLQTQSSNGAKVTVTGQVDRPLMGEGLDLRFDIAGPGGAVLGDLLDWPLPMADALAVRGRIKGTLSLFRVDDLDLRLGESDLRGELDVDLRGERPHISADLHSTRLDLSFLAKGREQAKAVPAEAAARRLIPDIALDLAPLALLDGDLKYRTEELRWAGLRLEKLNLTLLLRGGELSLRPSTARLAKGRLALSGGLSPAGLSLRLELRRAAMAILGPMLDFTALDGGLDLTADLRARGNDLRALAADLNGKVSVVVSDGHLESRFLNLLAEDLATAMFKGRSSEKGTRLNCFANSHDIKDGVAVSRVLLLDTDNITVVGQGQTDLRTEAIAYRLTPRPKDASLLSLATPINVGGSLAEPSFVPDSMAVAGSLATAVVGNLLLPGLGLLLPLLSTGTGEAHPCLDVVKDGQAVAAPAEAAKEDGATSILGRVGGAVSEGVGKLLQLPGKLLGSE